jgi:Bacterial fructose-1,6-bisphosphatase, glpX-encoded
VSNFGAFPITSPTKCAAGTALHGLCTRPLVTDIKPGTIQTTLFWTPGRGIGDVTVVILDRPRHEAIIRECRETGCRIKLISDGDVAAAIEVAKAGAAADIMMGIGGTPEGELLCNAVSRTVLTGSALWA